jgi:mono/diheme cytochrome c family protein
MACLIDYQKISRFSAVALFVTFGSIGVSGMARADSSVQRGQSLVHQHCSRCHVIPGLNPFGGIGSTPSFSAMKWLDDWRRRFEIFYTLPPHPALVRIEVVSDPRDKSLPAFSNEISLTLKEVDDILSFVETIKHPK